ncbi:uracil-DNA glycosylase-like protein [Gautieria morchelliformis]|nr:uracil-DNA glycosylase-like protein [Gautieria morchelliformis]
MEPAEALKHSISCFAFPPAQPSTPLRRSSRKCVTLKDEIEFQSLEAAIQLPKREGPKGDSDSDLGSPKKRRRILKRGYAHPEAYAHLNTLKDHLAPSLDVMFCGINPGCMSATKGHHFANPTNHFWKGLHLSGFTPRLLSPSEDATLPTCYSLGLVSLGDMNLLLQDVNPVFKTNLVERPSAEQAELSKIEMKRSVPSLKVKIANHRPRIVCFVGKGIWVIVEAVFKNHVGRNRHTTGSKSFEWGLQPYKLKAIITDKQYDIECPMPGSPVTETLFWVMPSTSGRVVSHQLNDKVKLFSRLRMNLEKIKSNNLDTSGMAVIPLT